jgi:hypothetical protein
VSKAGNDERVLYSFHPGGGATPFTSVLAVKGELYGTTGPGFPNGTVYEMNLEGKHARLLHHFTGPPDGWAPNGLTFFDGALYGTTSNGGKDGGSGSYPVGTVFKVSLPANP